MYIGTRMAERELNLFFLTYDRTGKETIEIFNDFVRATKVKIRPENVAEFLDYIYYVKDLEFDAVVISAELEGIIPRVFRDFS